MLIFFLNISIYVVMVTYKLRLTNIEIQMCFNHSKQKYKKKLIC